MYLKSQLIKFIYLVDYKTKVGCMLVGKGNRDRCRDTAASKGGALETVYQ